MRQTVLLTIMGLVLGAGCNGDPAPVVTADAETLSSDTEGDASGTPDGTTPDSTATPDTTSPDAVPDAEPELPSCPDDCGLLATCSADTNFECAPFVDACLDGQGVAEDGYCLWPDILTVYDTSCGAQASNPDQYVDCVESAGGFDTLECASCFAGLAFCARDECLFECFSGPNAPEGCQECIASDCADGWACAGAYECPCTPSCAEGPNACGDDGCGGSCGTCDAGPNDTCNDATRECQCQPDCIELNKDCGPDGCGGTCGTCEQGTCDADGMCICTPDCDGKVCGDDGCGGTCAPDCLDGEVCNNDQTACVCAPDCEGKNCGPDGCGGSCGVCQVGEPQCVSGVCSAGGSCAAPLAVSSVLPTFVIGDTGFDSGAVDSTYYNSSWCPGDTWNDFEKGSGVRDNVHLFVAPTAGTFTVTVTPVNPDDATDVFDAMVYVMNDCATINDVTVLECAKDDGNPGDTKSLTFSAVGGNTYYIVVDGRLFNDGLDTGIYTLTIE